MEACYHCGDKVHANAAIHFDNKLFCCSGCQAVYQILEQNDMQQFYDLETSGGNKPNDFNQHKYAFLDVAEIQKKYIEFEEKCMQQVTLFLPSIHCSSCIYLLENIQKINPAIKSCQVNFTSKEAKIAFDSQSLKLSELAILLDKIGYAPNFGDRKKTEDKINKQFMYKLGVAGFAFGSIMLWTVPEYLGIEKDNPEFRGFMAYLSLTVSIPVLLYSANEYLISAWKAIKYKSLNLDVPIAIGIIALYSQSVYSILTENGTGYMDSFAGFIFFLLIGKWFQNKTYKSLAFDRDYTSYFPVAITRIQKDSEEIVELEKLTVGDTILVRNEEVIPCDAELESDEATIDYSFVTGESEQIIKKKGDFVYAGGKISGQKVKFKVKAESSRSHLTSLWNKTEENKKQETSDKLSIIFIAILLIIAGLSAILWSFWDSTRIIEIVVAVLIVACPCALALSRPFTYGNIMRLLGRKGLYLKNAQVISALNSVDTIVFDKTGTLTTIHGQTSLENIALETQDLSIILSIVQSSTHPYSRQIAEYLVMHENVSEIQLSELKELKGHGLSAQINNDSYKVGSEVFVTGEKKSDIASVYVSKNDQLVAIFKFASSLRPQINQLMDALLPMDLHVLSGDSSRDLQLIQDLGINPSNIQFNQTPQSKYDYIETLENKGKKVLMVGDGLNDVGALKKATVGISVSEDVFQFSPSSDAILAAEKLSELSNLLKISKFSKRILAVCFSFSIIYNIIGLSFAISGQLSPLIAAILMPISSITVVFIATFGTLFFSPKN